MSMETLWFFCTAVIIVVATPGADMLYITANGISGGPKAGLASVAGVATGAYIHVLFAAFGLNVILSTSLLAYRAVVLVGAIYLAYIGITALLSKGGLMQVEEAPAGSLFQVWRQGVLVNLTKPKAVLFVLSFLPQFVNPQIGPVIPQFLILGGIIIATMLIVMTPIAIYSGRCGDWLRANPTISHHLNQIVGIFFVGMAGWIGWSRWI